MDKTVAHYRFHYHFAVLKRHFQGRGTASQNGEEERRWSFSGLATIVRIVLMYYLNLEKFLNQPDADLNIMLAEASESPPVSIGN